MKFSKGTLSLAVAVVAMISFNMIHTSSYYQTAKSKVKHAYDKTKSTAQDLYGKTTGQLTDSPTKVRMADGKMKTVTVPTTKQGTPYTPLYTGDKPYDQQVVEE